MSDTATAAPAVDQTPAEGEIFSATEIEQFEADDVTAGAAIGKMLSWLFLYTVVAMTLVGVWTYSVSTDSGADESAAVHSDH